MRRGITLVVVAALMGAGASAQVDHDDEANKPAEIEPLASGSLLLDLPEMKAHLGELVPGGFHYRWSHSDPRVDRLAEDVSTAAATASEHDEDPALTFDRVRALAAAAAGAAARPPVGLAAGRARPPRLTEPWFC